MEFLIVYGVLLFFGTIGLIWAIIYTKKEAKTEILAHPQMAS